MAQVNNDKGLIFNIQKFSIHDGNGIRTLVFMKGCPLRCLWCSNPESQSFLEEIMYIKKNCVLCGKCAIVCPENATDHEDYEIDRDRCTVCGACAEVCYANAKKKVGRWISVDELVSEIEKDRIFYRNSQGGVTIGGGEPIAQPGFVLRVLKECKRLNIHTAIETCGHSKWNKIERIFETVDQIFFDLKHMGKGEHKMLTGVTNRLILDNAKRVAGLNKDITFRIPLIPGYNDSEENIILTGRFVKGLMTPLNNIKTEILPYHNLGSDKYASLGIAYGLGKVKAPEADVKEHFNDILISIGCNVTK
jgi:pyruvate formate lyase activating enzyme